MRVIAIEEAFSFPGVTPPFRPGAAGVSGHWLQEWSRRLADTAELRLADMDAHGVDIQVLSLTSGVEIIPDPAEAAPAARKANDYLAQVVAAHPARFAGFAALPLQDPDLAVADAGSWSVSVLLNTGDWSTTPQASSFAVSGFPSSTTAGGAGSFTVTAKNTDGTTATGYAGTVHFTSSDGKASLPANYTFTATDAGVHTFSATLKTAGTQGLTVTDTWTASLTGSEADITVNPAAASTMIVAGFPSPTTAGVAGSFAVTLKDPYGNTATGYTGMVQFTSSDRKVSLPANYTFTATDAGVHTFSAILKTAGTQSLTAKDTTTASLTGTDGGITVNQATASKFIISAPSRVTAGVAFSLTVTVQDAYGNVVTGYTGTIHFKSTDTTATLPGDYTFTAADKGMHTFTGLVLRKKGKQTITITDTLNSSITGSVIENVL